MGFIDYNYFELGEEVFHFPGEVVGNYDGFGALADWSDAFGVDLNLSLIHI